MVYITSEDGIKKKFACIKCIKGHRSTKCSHTTRELFEIKKKGRPVSQCESCRQLRKTKQIHIKCMCHLNVKLKEDTLDTTPAPTIMDEGFRHSNLSANVTSDPPSLPQLPPLTTLTNPPLSGSCMQCERPTLYCICKKGISTPKSSENIYTSSSSSDGSVTPPVYQLNYPERPLYSAGLNSNNNDKISSFNNNNNSPITQQSPTIQSPTSAPSSTTNNEKNPNLRHLTIPIHDPSDDIDSDTPIYKSHEENSTTLGEFTNTSSEELMDQIYSGFIGNDKNGKTSSSSHSSPLLREADQQLAELSKDD